MKRFKWRDILFLVVPTIFLLGFGLMLPALRRPIGPAHLRAEKIVVETIAPARAVDEIYTPMDQAPIPNGVKISPKFAAPYKGLDHKITVELNYQGDKPSWWGEDEPQTLVGNGFLKSTAADLAWNVNNQLEYQINGRQKVYMSPGKTAGIFVRGNPRYDAALDRYVAMFYLPLSQVPTKDGEIKFVASFWCNGVSPPAEVAVNLGQKQQGRHVVKDLILSVD